MILKTWPDGFVLNMDPRREDPLFYYLERDEWSSAIGLQVLPLYREKTEVDVEISVFDEHRPRELALDRAAREALYVRAVPVLIEHHPHWKRVRLAGTNLEAVIRSDGLAKALREKGFEPEGGAPRGTFVWRHS